MYHTKRLLQICRIKRKSVNLQQFYYMYNNYRSNKISPPGLHRIGHFCHCLIKIMSTKKLKIGEKEALKTQKGCEKMTFCTLFFVKAITLR